MLVCFAIEKDEGNGSRVFGHFGSAPFFMIVDTDLHVTGTIPNGNLHHAHGTCSPLRALGGREVDAVVVGGIGPAALGKLAALGVRVYRTSGGTVGEDLDLLRDGGLEEFPAEGACSGHAGCGN